MSKENEEINEAMIAALKKQVELLEGIIKIKDDSLESKEKIIKLKDDSLESKEKIIKLKDEQIALYRESLDRQIGNATIKFITSKLIISDTYDDFYNSIKEELMKNRVEEDTMISSFKIAFSFISVGADLDGTLNEVWNNRQSIINTINLI